MGGGRVSVGTEYESDRAEKADAFTTSSDFSTTEEDLAGGKHLSKKDNIYGPVQKRSVRDIPFLILFILFVLAWIALGAFSFFAGDMNRYGTSPLIRLRSMLTFYEDYGMVQTGKGIYAESKALLT